MCDYATLADAEPVCAATEHHIVSLSLQSYEVRTLQCEGRTE